MFAHADSSWARGMLAMCALACVSAPSLGHPIYQRSLGTPTGIEVAYDVDRTDGERYCAVGTIAASTTAPSDVLAGTFQDDGTTIWTRRLFSNARDAGYTIHRTADGGFIIGAESNGLALTQLGLFKLDAVGNTMWAFVYGGTAFVDFPLGVSVREAPSTAAVPDLVAVGRRDAFLGVPRSGVLLRTNSLGVPFFQRAYATITVTGAPGFLSFADVRPNTQGFVVCGNIDNRQFGGRIVPFLMQTDGGGNLLWTRTYTFPGLNVDATADGLDLDSTGEIVFSGRLDSVGVPVQPTSLLVVRTDPLGNPLWAQGVREFTNGFQAIQIVHNRKIVVAGTTPTNAAVGQQAAIAEFDPAGVYLFGTQYGAQGDEQGHGFTWYDCGHGYTTVGLSNIPGAPGTGDWYLIGSTVTGDTPCLDSPYGVNFVLPIQPQQPTIVFNLQQNIDAFPLQNQVITLANVVHCRAQTCPADVDDGSGTGKPDTGVDINDLLYFLAQYGAGLPCADLDDGTGTGTPDGGVDINDLLYFLAHYEAGC